VRKVEHSFRNGANGAALAIRVIPRSRRDEFVEIMDDGVIKIRLTAPPLEGRANQALIRLLSNVIGAPESAFSIVAGAKNRDKLITIEGLDAATVEKRIRQHISG
jgi:uncharacterized protein (TIGR00251 family)